VAGPLTERLQKIRQAPPPPPLAPAQEPPKKKKKKKKIKIKKDPVTREPDPFFHRLRMFNGFDDGGFHPTVEFRVVRDDDMNITGVKQLYRKRRSDEFEWRDMKDFNFILDNIPVPRPSVSEVLGIPAEVQSDPLTPQEAPCQSET
jgi:hypothetical protein